MQRKGEMLPSEKLLYLFTIMLFSRGKRSLSELAEELDCSVNTVKRKLDELGKFGGGRILSEKDGRKEVYWMEKDNKLKLNLNADGLRELMICKNFLSNIMPESIKKEMNTALLRASEYANEDSFDLNSFAGVGITVSKGRIDYSKFQAQYDALVKAVVAKRVCSITYKNGNTLKTRSIAPVNIIALGGTIYVQGWVIAETGKAVAKYTSPLVLSLHKIAQVQLEKRSWETLPAIDASSFGLLNTGRIKAVVKFTGYVTEYIQDRIWSDDQTIEPCEGGIILTFTSSSKPELISWVLSFGAQAELLEPAELRQELRREAEGMA
ncbi:MAG: WYL domain-containing protein [Deferribacteraceae bacterium]|jgi:predicted DNA-binding transcriptional regulator YafY|nr:WYL domain-containing protein [Deferribacteraceae bacterium]